MALQNIDANEKALGNLLQIIFSQGVHQQISTDHRDWEMVSKLRAKVSPAREYKFMLQTSLGIAAVQSRNPGLANRPFPSAQKISTSEHTAKFKQIQATIELDYDSWDRARKSPEKYAEPLALEMQSKTTATKRIQAARLYGDGTGVIGTAASAAVTSPASDKLVFTLSSNSAAAGFVGFFEYEDILVLRAADGTASALDTNLATEPVYWSVVEKDRETNTVILQGLDANLQPVANITSISVQPTAGDVFYRFGQQEIPDLTSISDYGFVTDALIGLESLASNDGLSVYGITMTGATAASRLSAGGQPLDVSHIHKALDKVKLRVGQDAYKWKMMTMSPEAHYALIEGRETDRRFQTVTDNKRGTTYFAYQHGNDAVETVTSEYVPMKRIWMLPEAKTGKKVLEYAGSDFETVKAPGGSDFQLKVDGGAYVNAVQSFLNAYCLMVCKHPAAIACVEDFTL
jgi:hypothetical protein